MEIIDTHSHLFLEEFAEDLPLVVERARMAGVSKIFMPNIDCSTVDDMLRVSSMYKEYCYPMIGLHPTSVKDDYETELDRLERMLETPDHFTAIGEIGMDLYWDKTFVREQAIAFDRQIQWALKYGLPIVIHSRDSFEEVCNVMEPYRNGPLSGIFHSFTGTAEEAARLMGFKNFKLGINGVVTFKKSTLPEALQHVPLDRIVLETDSPYLAPVPNRGKRNESANVKDTLRKVAEVYRLPVEEVAKTTTDNALEIFKMLG